MTTYNCDSCNKDFEGIDNPHADCDILCDGCWRQHNDGEYTLVSGLSYADLDPTMHDGDGDY